MYFVFHLYRRNESAEKIGKQDLNFKISYNQEDEFGQLCTVFEKMREKSAENNCLMWNMIDEQKQMRSAFSHDLRTPLAVMTGYVEYLLLYYPKNKLSKEKIMEVLGELQSQTERISCFADTMKSINRLDEMVINREGIDKDELLTKTETILTVLAGNYQKQFEIHSEVEKQELYLDLSRLTVRVRDDGKGFPSGELKRVVKPYYHGEDAGAEHYGMGLYICKILCEKQGGFLQVYNPPGGGACVEFYIVA